MDLRVERFPVGPAMARALRAAEEERAALSPEDRAAYDAAEEALTRRLFYGEEHTVPPAIFKPLPPRRC